MFDTANSDPESATNHNLTVSIVFHENECSTLISVVFQTHCNQEITRFSLTSSCYKLRRYRLRKRDHFNHTTTTINLKSTHCINRRSQISMNLFLLYCLFNPLRPILSRVSLVSTSHHLETAFEGGNCSSERVSENKIYYILFIHSRAQHCSTVYSLHSGQFSQGYRVFQPIIT